ncbi:MAG: hypothetical protein ACRBCK_08025 [Alphaproteobacteria bacterium]
MSIKNQYKITTHITLCAFAMLYTIPTNAQSKEHTSPLHIKIAPQKHKNSSQNLRILTAKTPVTHKKPVKPHENEKNAHKTEEKPTENHAKHIQNTPCHVIETKFNANTTNKHKNLADSLKAYITEKKRDPTIITNIYNTSKETEISFELLLVKAMIESDLGRVTTSKTSSAKGIFQYIEPTWLVLMKRYGHRIGYTSYANAIEINTKTLLPQIKEGSKISRSEILALRENTKISALIKAHQIKDESKVLKNFKNGGRVNATDHYIAHMLGLSQARIFYKLREDKSSIILSDSKNLQLKQAVKLNPYFFFDNENNGLTAIQAYQQFHKKISQQFTRLKEIDTKYGQGNNLSQDCHVPKIRNAKTGQETRPDISSIMALAKNYKATSYKIKTHKE